MTDGGDSYLLTNGVLYGECNGHNGWQLWDRQIRQQSVNVVSKWQEDEREEGASLTLREGRM